MFKIISLLFFSFGAQEQVDLKKLNTKYTKIPALESAANRKMAEYGISGGEFVFLTPFSENVNIETSFSVLFLKGLDWNGQNFPAGMRFMYEFVPDLHGPSPEVSLSKVSGTQDFAYAGVNCVELLITKKYIGCKLSQKLSTKEMSVPSGSFVAFPNVAISQKPKVEYIWLSVGKGVAFGKQYKNMSVIKVYDNKAELGSDANTDELHFVGKND